jgi:hypothetical protein
MVLQKPVIFTMKTRDLELTASAVSMLAVAVVKFTQDELCHSTILLSVSTPIYSQHLEHQVLFTKGDISN